MFKTFKFILFGDCRHVVYYQYRLIFAKSLLNQPIAIKTSMRHFHNPVMQTFDRFKTSVETHFQLLCKGQTGQ